jgi:hypothetical protein
MLSKPKLYRKTAVWTVSIIVGGTGLVWAGRTAWVAYETWGTPTCSWPVQVRGTADLAQHDEHDRDGGTVRLADEHRDRRQSRPQYPHSRARPILLVATALSSGSLRWAGSTYRSGGCLAPTMGCHVGEPDEP